MTTLDTYATDVDAVCAALQQGYGDATQTTLDRKVVRDVIATLRARGWASLDDVARLIESAGGTITVPDDIVMDHRERTVTRSVDHAAGTRFTVTKR